MTEATNTLWYEVAAGILAAVRSIKRETGGYEDIGGRAWLETERKASRGENDLNVVVAIESVIPVERFGNRRQRTDVRGSISIWAPSIDAGSDPSPDEVSPLQRLDFVLRDVVVAVMLHQADSPAFEIQLTDIAIEPELTPNSASIVAIVNWTAQLDHDLYDPSTAGTDYIENVSSSMEEFV